MARRKQNENTVKRKRLYNNYFNMYKNLCLNRFEWTGLPKGMNQEYIEEILFNDGKAVFVDDEMLGKLVLGCMFEDKLNVYGRAIKWRGIGFNYNKPYNEDNSIVIKNNRLMTSTKQYLSLMCDRLADLDISIDMNTKMQRTPYVAKVDDKTILSFKNIYRDLEEGVPVIYADKGMSLNDLEIFPTIAPYVEDKLSIHKERLINELYTTLGINNSNVSKRERVLVDEANANNEIIEHNLLIMLDSRKQACEEINKMFGTDIKCELKGEEEDGTIHNGTEGDNGGLGDKDI